MKYIFYWLAIVALPLKAQTYISDSVRIPNDSITLSGTFSYPSGKGKFPTLILISGTGQQDRDATFGTHKPFFEMADYLTQQGYAVLRVDDRGTGLSTGIYQEATTRDFATDVMAELDFLKKNKHVDKKQIGLIGHSEGGAVAFMVAAERNDVAFLISLAGLAVDGYTSMLLQNRALLSANPNLSAQVVDDYMDMYTVLFGVVKNTPLKEDLEQSLDSAFNAWYANTPKETREGLGFIEGRDNYFMSRYKYTALTPWYRQMMQYQPADYLTKITVPVLALNGDKDVMVTPDENLGNIKKCLDEAGNTKYKIVRMPNHNHLLQHCETGAPSEYLQLPEAISKETLDTIGTWLKQVER